MIRTPWTDFVAAHPRAHLVVLALPDYPKGPTPASVQRTMGRVIRRRPSKSQFAVAVIRQSDRPEVHVAFADGRDAASLAAEHEAQPSSRHEGWASEATVALTADRFSAAAAAPPPGPNHS